MEVQTSSLETANYVKTHISNFLQENVFPQLEAILDTYNRLEKIMRIDSILLNIDPTTDFSLEEIGAEIMDQFSLELSKKIESSIMKEENEIITNGVEALSLQDKQKEMFLFFVENGYLPWSGRVKDIETFVQFDSWAKAMDDTVFTSKLFILLKQNKTAMNRFSLQFSSDLIISLLFSTLGNNNSPVVFDQFNDAIKKMISNRNKEWIILFHDKLIGFLQKSILFSVDTKREILSIISKVFENELEPSYLKKDNFEVIDESRARAGEKDKEQFEDESFFEAIKNEIAIQNAGLILLHPFLKSFFEKLDILDEKGGIKKTELQLAIQTLHYLATGKEEFFEGKLVFEKFLCGIPLKIPIERKSLLTDRIKNESQLLLTEVIQHWPALKNTSPDGLRQLFIQRDGKLIQGNNNYKLIVERKAQDVLLDRLDWNISMIKLPWRKELVTVEW